MSLDRRRSRGSISCCLLALLLASCLQAQNPADSPSVTIRSNVRLVQIDVIAKDKHGNPIPGLEAKDFTLLDDGTPQKITRLTVEHGIAESTNPKGAADAPKQPGPPTFSNTHPDNVVPTVILFDVLNTALEDQPSMKKGLLQSLNHMTEGTPVALLILGDDLTVVSDFTSSTISLADAAESRLDLRMEGFGPPLRVRPTGMPTIDRMIIKAATTAFHAEDRERIMRTLAALRLIATQLSRMQGRKSLLWISAGVNASSQTTDVEDAIDKLNDANVAVYTVDARGLLLDPGVSAETDTSDLTLPLQIEREEKRADVLSTVAASTGGVAYRNTNHLESVISQALSDRSLVYVLEYYPRHGDWNGKFHTLRVRSSRPGVRLRYRTSYRATLPKPLSQQEQQQMLAALASSPLDYAGIRFNAWIQPQSDSDPRFILHIPVAELQWSVQEGTMSGNVQVWFIQKRASGDDLVTSNLNTDFRLAGETYQAAVRDGVSLASDLQLDPSAARVRVMLLDVNSGKIGTVDVPVAARGPNPKPH